jgi:hypothetical protein
MEGRATAQVPGWAVFRRASASLTTFRQSGADSEVAQPRGVLSAA